MGVVPLAFADLAPSPVERVEVMPHRGVTQRSSTPPRVVLWVKRDDRVSSRYGGNKVRKLDHLLEVVKAEGKTRVLTLGAAGSHHVVATAIFARSVGLEVEAVLVPQPPSARGARNLRVALAHGLRAMPVGAWSRAPLAVLAAARRGRGDGPSATAFLPLGGSNVIGSLGFVDAARELAAQVRAGLAPEPAAIVVAMGSGGTAAGLAAGLEHEGLRTRVVGVAISQPVLALELAARRLTYATARAIGLSRGASARAVARLDVDGGYVGDGYGLPTEAGRIARARAEGAGVALDDCYTAKAFAAALDRASSRPAAPVLFWHTLSTVPWPDGVDDATLDARPLPPELARLFR
jgi:1-aminocyclopropane-1-carboxylate deaminase/D-cysteine desulfhydrase-like pyridoxal-dependent ACC family enzyme